MTYIIISIKFKYNIIFYLKMKNRYLKKFSIFILIISYSLLTLSADITQGEAKEAWSTLELYVAWGAKSKNPNKETQTKAEEALKEAKEALGPKFDNSWTTVRIGALQTRFNNNYPTQRDQLGLGNSEIIKDIEIQKNKIKEYAKQS